jgi:valyl-tRNA synthetase
MALLPNYDPKRFESEIYERWLKAGVGKPESQELEQTKSLGNKKMSLPAEDGLSHASLTGTSSNANGNAGISPTLTHAILMPPPNLTGNLHAGHAFQHYLMDTLSRIARQRGQTNLWYPGVDHAGIQLEGVIDKLIKAGEFDEIIKDKLDQSELAKTAPADKTELPKWLKQNAREIWLELAWMKAEEWRNNQQQQAAVLGDTPDYSRQLFTLDERANRMVMRAFEQYWEDGLIYKGQYMINWSVGLQTALSDFQQDVEWVEQQDPFVTFEYILEPSTSKSEEARLNPKINEVERFIVSKLRKISVSTVRPETIFGDVAIAIHPVTLKNKLGDGSLADSAYNELISGQIWVNYKIPFTRSNKYNNRCKLVISDKVDPDFGTGALKITPAHDQVDFDFYKEFVADQKINPGYQQAIGRDGKLTEIAGEFAEIPVLQGRVAVIKKLIENGHVPVKAESRDEKEKIKADCKLALASEEFNPIEFSYSEGLKRLRAILGENADKLRIDWNYTHNVLYCERSKTQVEPLISEEFFLSYHTPAKSKGQTLLEFGRIGVSETRFHPAEMAERASAILDNLKDWCISRDLVWGQRIPVWYNLDVNPQKVFYSWDQTQTFDSPPIKIQATKPTEPGRWVQEDKILDTWFSSCLWPLTTLDFYDYLNGQKNTDFEKFYPTQVLTTGTDILYAWILRMIILCKYWTGRTPFENLVITPTLLDEQGKKMSKSLKNGLDPVDQIDKFSSDSLRMALLGGMIPSRNMRMGGQLADKLTEKYRNFGNKLWNVARFLESKNKPD